MAQGTNNKGGRAVMVNVTAEDDDGPFLSLQIEDDETLDDIADVVFTDEAEVDEFLADVTQAVEKFRELRRASS
jgi:uncharacterized protein YciI